MSKRITKHSNHGWDTIIRHVDEQSTPYNSRYRTAVLLTEFTVCPIDPEKPSSGWLQIFMEEVQTPEDNRDLTRTVTRQIHECVGVDAMRELRDALNAANLGDK